MKLILVSRGHIQPNQTNASHFPRVSNVYDALNFRTCDSEPNTCLLEHVCIDFKRLYMNPA